MLLVNRYLVRLSLLLLLGITAACTEELSEQDHLDRVKVHEEKGEINAAIIELKNALQKNPKNPQSRFHLGELSLQKGDLVSAEKELFRAKKLGVPQNKLQILLGRALLGQGKFSDAIEQIDPSLESDHAQRITAQLLQGDAYFGLEEFVKARAIFSVLMKTEKHDARVIVGMARAELVSGNAPATEDYLSHALAIEPDNIGALFILGSLKNQQKKFVEGEQQFTRALKKLPKDHLTTQVITARAGVTEALLGQGKIGEARKHIDALLAEIPNHPATNYLKGYADYLSRDLVSAAESLQKVLRVVPDHPPSLMLLGAVNYGRGNLEQAETYLTRAFTADDANVGVRKLLAATRLQLNQPTEALSALSNEQGLMGDDAQILSLSGTARIVSGDVKGGLEALERSVEANPGDRALRLGLAGGYLSSGKSDQALALLRELPSVGTDLRRESMLARAYLATKQLKRAESLAEQLLKARPKSAEAHFLVGMIYSATDKQQAARERFTRVTELQPDNAEAWINLGRLSFHEQDNAEAQQYFERALSETPNSVTAMTLLAYVLERRGDQVQAIEWLEKARASDANAIDARLALIRHYLPKHRQELVLTIAQEAVRAAPTSTVTQNALGIVHMVDQDYKSALDPFKTVTQLTPESADAFHNLARVYIGLQDMPRARQALNTSLKIDPEHTAAMSTLVELETRQGHYKKALSIALQQQKKQPKQANGFVLEGDVHMLNQQPTKAVQAYKKAWRKERSQTTTIKLFTAQRKTGVVDAKNTIHEWLSDNPDDNRAKMVLALTHHEDGENQQAETLYRDIIDAEPNAVEALNNLAWIYYLNGDKESIKLAERAHQLAPGVGAITDTLGWILIETGETQRGVKYLHQANQELPNTPDIQYHLAAGLAKLNKRDEARALLDAALSSGQTFENQGKARQLLKTLQ